MTGLERQQHVSSTGWALPMLTPAPAAGKRQRSGPGAACAGNFHPFPRAGSCTLTPVPSTRSAQGPAGAPVGREPAVFWYVCPCDIASELPVASLPKEGGAGPECDGWGWQLLAHRLHDAHFIHAKPAGVFIYINYMLFLIATRLLKHLQMLQPSTAELHSPWRALGAPKV